MLVIHPFDASTDFLCQIYKGIDCEVIRNGHYPNAQLRKKLKQHDRILFLGHGTENGLLRTPIDGNLLISSKLVHLFRDKECIYIWCNADKFVKKYNLTGVATGMIISEPNEAFQCDVPFTREMIMESNSSFSQSLAPNILKDKFTIVNNFIKMYSNPNNDIINFNKTRIFTF